MTHGAAISNGRTFAKRVPAPAHCWANRSQYTTYLNKGITNSVACWGSVVIAVS